MITRGRRRGVHDSCWLARGSALLFAILLSGGIPSAAAEALTIRVKDGQSLRDIAEEYLGDPDMWVEILRANALSSITDVRPGLELVIPAAEIAAANRALGKALQAIQDATEEGARLFAAAEIEKGFQLYEAGLARRKAGEWAAAASLADEAALAATEARKIAAAQRDRAAEALLSDRHGWVEGRKAQDLVWTDRALNAVLIEEEKLRTLSRSSAQITFLDESRIRLGANAQAVIQRMRVDPLSRREEAKVSLVEGDFYALLSGESERTAFELDVPEVRTAVDSRSFWVRRDDSGVKFTNYDDQALGVAANGGTVTLGRNEGTLVRSGQAPSGKIEILPATELLAPADDSQAFEAQVALRWAAVSDAAGYWLELARDPEFRRMVISRWGLKAARFDTGALEMGTYYWRIAALDKFGLPGARSAVWRFHLRVDHAPPYLRIREPAGGTIIRTNLVRVRGETETGARLLLNGAGVEVGDDGGFDVKLDAQPGDNALTFEATDSAGNVTKRTRSFFYVPDTRAALIFDDGIPRLAPRHFVTDQAVISLAGTTDPGARLLVYAAGEEPRAATYARDDGRFALNLPLSGSSEAFTIEVVQRSGFASRDRFTVSQDHEPPPIVLEAAPPAVTAVEWLPLRGRAEGARSLSVNGRSVQLMDDLFDETVTLHQGANHFELIATDPVGNVRVERFDVELDQEPPEILGYDLSSRTLRSGEPLRIEVKARDISGLRKVASVRIRIGETDYADLLELSGATGTYRGTLLPPPGAAGRVTLTEVEIEDYAGNKARLKLSK